MTFLLLATSTPNQRASSRGPPNRKAQAWGDDSTPSPVSVSIPYGESESDRNGERDRDRDRDRDWERDRDKERVREAIRGSSGIERSKNSRTSDRDKTDQFCTGIISK